jgi:preprotein translocase subunit SecY
VRDKTQTNSAAPGDRLIRAGAIVFFIGAVATLVTVAPLFLGTTPFPTYMFGLSMLMAVGFLMAGAGVLQSVAAGRRQARGASGASR